MFVVVLVLSKIARNACKVGNRFSTPPQALTRPNFESNVPIIITAAEVALKCGAETGGFGRTKCIGKISGNFE